MTTQETAADLARCPECGAEVEYIVDGQWTPLQSLLARPFAPRSIERRIYHARTCTRGRDA